MGTDFSLGLTSGATRRSPGCPGRLPTPPCPPCCVRKEGGGWNRRRHPERPRGQEAPQGGVELRGAVAKEFRRVLGKPGPDNPGTFEAFSFITEGEKRGLIATYGEDRVFTQNLVLAVKEKPATPNAEARVRARIVMADLAKRASKEQPIETFVANVDGNTTRLLAQMSVQNKDFFLDSNDCSDAYYMGTPYPMSDPKGRILLGRIPGGWEEFGYPQFNEHGGRNSTPASSKKCQRGAKRGKASATSTARSCSRGVSRKE